MHNEWNMREFTRLCKENGFTRVAKDFYARCIGDGVFQTIHTDYKQYIYPFSPEYSEKHRKANTVSIGIFSLYAKWEDPLALLGMYSPSDLGGPREIHFPGFNAHCNMMEEMGFAFLNEITDQEKLLEARLRTDSNYGNRSKWIHDLWLSAPLMVCGRWDDATYEVCHHYTHSWEIFHGRYDALRNDEHYREYLAKEDEFMEKLKLTRLMWTKLLVRDYAWIQDFLSDNLNRNMLRLREHGISIIE